MSRHGTVQRFALLLIFVITLSACGGGGGSTAATSAPAAGGAATSAPGAEATAASANTTATAATTSGGTSGAATTIKWGFWGSPEEKASHEKVAAAFMKAHPEIKIEVWHQPWDDYFTKLKTLWASGDKKTIPDVLFLWPTPSYAATGVLENLDPWIKKSNYNVQDYWPNLLESAKYKGSIYGFPRDISSEVLYYNKAIFDEAKIPYPTDKWTWDDLTAALQKLTAVESNGRVKRYGMAMEGGNFQLWVGQNKGSILDDMRNPSKCTLADPPAMQAVKFFSDLMRKNLAMPNDALKQAGGDATAFQSGLAAMIIQNASRIPTFNAAKMNYDVQVVPIPKNGQRAGSAGGAAWVMSAQSSNKEAAWTFLQWLQSTNGGEPIYAANGDILPALKSVAQSDAFLKSGQAPTNRQAFLTEAENAKPGRFGYFAEWDELNSTIISPAMDRIWTGEVTPEQTLPAVCKQVDTYLKNHGFPKK